MEITHRRLMWRGMFLFLLGLGTGLVVHPPVVDHLQ
jgi:hypothetical protein